MRRWKKLKSFVGRLVLRGRLADWWVQRRIAKIEQRFLRELVTAPSRPPKAVPRVTKIPETKLQELLLIGDFMWEMNDLVPELSKICRVVPWDLHQTLMAQSCKLPPPGRVVMAISDHIKQDKRVMPDLILFYARPSLLSEEAFALLRKHFHCPIWGMNLDDKLEFLPYGVFSSENDNYQKWAAHFDLNITNGKIATDWYKARGFPCVFSPQGVHQPPGLTLPTDVNFQHVLSFLGSWKPERHMLVSQLQNAGIHITLFGKGWPDARWVENTAEVFRSTQINLGIGLASPSLALTTTKGRDFECPGVGACYLTTYNWELTEHYEIGKEILCYRGMEELIEMISYYRCRPEECLKIAQAAWRRCSAEHTWEQRFRKIFAQFGFSV